jgi:acetolactate synthase-1/2/3 large subunit
VDDSQMFGGLISERYDLLPAGSRVFGDHSGFVGGGLATATGLALGEPAHRVLCTLGDQGFGNAMQCLVPAAEANARLLILVCNNGESVSLRKQARASLPGYRGGLTDYLTNSPGLSYRRVAEALGAATWLVEVDPGADDQRCGEDLRRALREAAAVSGPALVELRLPSDPDFWRGIWITQGFESTHHDEVSRVR